MTEAAIGRLAARRQFWTGIVLLKIVLVLALLLGAAACLIPAGLFDISVDRVWSTFFNPGAASREEVLIAWTLRVPRILMALVVGAMLGVAGASMQSVTRNGLADLCACADRGA